MKELVAKGELQPEVVSKRKWYNSYESGLKNEDRDRR